jgi:hypothetical protein
MNDNATFKPAVYYADTNGMSRSEMPHLLPDGTWYNTYNVQFVDGYLKQTPPQEFVMKAIDPDITFVANKGFTCLAPFVVDGTEVVVIALGAEACVQLNFDTNTGTIVTLPGPPAADVGNFNRWQAVNSANLHAGLFQYDGTAATDVITAGINYKAKYVEIYQGHLVLANLDDAGTKHPLRIAWSDKDDFGDFDPLTTNEADFFELTDNAYNALFAYGITGLKRIGNELAIHTPGSIWTMQYVGFQNGVMNLYERVTGVGCWLPYALISFDRFHIFPARDDFYIFDGATIQSIGANIKTFFYNDLTKDPILRQRTWGTVDVERQELRWYYVSTASSDSPDKCLVLNWPRKAWYVETAFGRTAVLYGGLQTFRSIDGLAFLVDDIDDLDPDVATTIDGLAASNLLPYSIFAGLTTHDLYRDLEPDEFGQRDLVGEIVNRVFAGEDQPIAFTYTPNQPPISIYGGALLEDINGLQFPTLSVIDGSDFTLSGSAVDFNSGLFYRVHGVRTGWPQVELETRDYDLRDPTQVKELDTVVIDADLNHNDAETDFGWELYISVRVKFGDDVNFKFFGLWDGSNFTKRVSGARLAGHIVRFKFKSRNLGFANFYGYAPYMYARTAER